MRGSLDIMAKDETIYISSVFILYLAIKAQAPEKRRKKTLKTF